MSIWDLFLFVSASHFLKEFVVNAIFMPSKSRCCLNTYSVICPTQILSLRQLPGFCAWTSYQSASSTRVGSLSWAPLEFQHSINTQHLVCRICSVNFYGVNEMPSPSSSRQPSLEALSHTLRMNSYQPVIMQGSLCSQIYDVSFLCQHNL